MILQPVSSGAQTWLSHQRVGIELAGDYDAANRVYEFPEPVVHTPPTVAVRLYHGGRRMRGAEFQIFESVEGSGDLDRVRILAFAPNPSSILLADYTAA